MIIDKDNNPEIPCTVHRHGRVHLPHLFDAKDLNPLGRYRVPVCGISGLLSLSLFFLTLHRTKLAKYNAF